MRSRVDRRFTILDAMAMMAAIAVGCFLARFTMDKLDMAKYPSWLVVRGSWAVMLPLTWMLAALRTTAPRPRFQTPGSSACVTVVIVSFCMLLFYSHNVIGYLRAAPTRIWSDSRYWSNIALYVLTPMPLAASVAAAWSIMALDGRWRPEPTWLDRSGRAVGIYWILAGVAIPTLNIWHNWR